MALPPELEQKAWDNVCGKLDAYDLARAALAPEQEKRAVANGCMIERLAVGGIRNASVEFTARKAAPALASRKRIVSRCWRRELKSWSAAPPRTGASIMQMHRAKNLRINEHRVNR